MTGGTTGTTPAQLQVTNVDGTGGVLSFVVTRPGTGYATTTNVATVADGASTGTLATIDILTIGNTPFDSLVGVQATLFTAGGGGSFGTPSITNVTGVQVVDAEHTDGFIVETIKGVEIQSLGTKATKAYGLHASAPTGGTSGNYAIYLPTAGRDGGITFGTSTNPTANLYSGGRGFLVSDGWLTVTPSYITVPSPTTVFPLQSRPQFNISTGSLSNVIALVAETYLTGSLLATNGVATISVNINGTGYVVGDIVTVTGSTGTAASARTRPVTA